MKIKSLGLLLLLCSVKSLNAQEVKEMHPVAKNWYAGLQVGMPMGISTFTSFGADKTRMGFSGGVFGGYHLSAVWSLEASIVMGKMGMSADKDCASFYYGADGERYLAPVAGMATDSYANLYNSVSMNRVGVQLNMDVLQLIRRNEARRLSLAVSPAIYAMGTKATVKRIDTDAQVSKGDAQWQLGLGANLTAGYRLGDHLTAALYTGAIYVAGDHFDGVPESVHDQNYVWESGVKVGWVFGKSKPKPAETTPDEIPTDVVEPAQVPVDTVAVVAEPEPVAKPAPVDTVVAVPVQQEKYVTLPTVYFPYNGIYIEHSENAKMNRMLEMLRTNPNMRVVIEGWCDQKGTNEANCRVSLQRAKAVRQWLTAHGIAEDRITVVGQGTDSQASDAEKARRTDTKGKEEKQ